MPFVVMSRRYLLLVLGVTGASLTAPTATHAQAAPAGTVFLDRNANGVRDAGEPGIAGVTVSNQVAVVRTDRDGRFQLPDAGTGVVFVTQPRGHRATRAWWAPSAGTGALDFGLATWREPVPFTFVHASDPHIAPPVVARTRRMLALTDSLAPSMLVVTGDLVRDALRVGEAEARGYYTLWEAETHATPRPIYTVPGNHEIFGVERTRSGVSESHPLYGRGMYRSFRGPDYYSFDAGGVHFVALNTVDVDDQWYHGHVDSLQMAWLARDLALVPDSMPVVTFNHIPMYSLGEELFGYSAGEPAPTLITVKGKTQFRHTVSNTAQVLAAIGRHRWEIALAGHVHHRELLALGVNGQPLRFHQASSLAATSAAGMTFAPGVTLYTVRNGHVDDGRFFPLDAPRPDSAAKERRIQPVP